MLTIGIDPHKQTHSGVAVDPLGVQITQRTVAARREGFGQLLEWARKLHSERLWVLEDVRHVSGSLERFLIDRGETVVRLPPRLMANARRGVRERGKSDPIDALAIARNRHGVDVPAAAPGERVTQPPPLRLQRRERTLHTLLGARAYTAATSEPGPVASAESEANYREQRHGSARDGAESGGDDGEGARDDASRGAPARAT
jgi:transposase